MRESVTLLPTLWAAQEENGELTTEAQKELAETLGLPLRDIAGAVSFYSAFSGASDGEWTELPVRKAGSMLSLPEDYAALRRVRAEHTDILALIRQAGLLGRSGSGFPVADKWELTKNASGAEKYIVANGSEGEGATAKDRALLENAPHAVIEGMLLCAEATGISQGILYVRAEYETAFRAAKAAAEKARKDGILNGFNLQVIRGGGAYVAGEETGLLQSLEGKRAEPRLKPPYPGTCGLFGKPTILNNAETFAAVAALIHDPETALTKLYTVTGCETEGVYECVHTVTARELLALSGGMRDGKALKGFQLGGGATGSFAGADRLDTELSVAGCRKAGLSLGTGSIRFIAEDESPVSLALESTAFLAEQSCGMCVPCRYGLPELTRGLQRLMNGEMTQDELRELREFADYISQNARCALGQAAPTAFISAYDCFRNDFENLCREEDDDAEL